jgi:hypothetical protein
MEAGPVSDFVDYNLGLLEPGAVVEVALDTSAFVRLLDGPNFRAYQNGQECRFFGGEAVRSPVPITVPHSGNWHVVIDFNGGAGQVRSSVNVLTPA